MTHFKKTDEQTHIINTVPDLTRRGKSSIIEARAGAGKTTILKELFPLLPSGGKCLAFNKAIADTLALDLPPNAASTFHSLGYALLRDRLQTCKSDPRKIDNLAREKMSIDYAAPYKELISTAKISGWGLPGFHPINQDTLTDLFEQSDIELPKGVSPEEFVQQSHRLFILSLRETATIDFDDMLYLPLHLAAKYKWKFDQFPFLMIDEAQDVSPLRLALVRSLTSIVIAVGDPYQGIYRFAGAMANALTSIKDTYDATPSLLSYSFRCPSTITEYASSLLPAPDDIKSLPQNAGGEVLSLKRRTFPYPTSPTEAFLCRTNAPLFGVALKMLRLNQPIDLRSDFPRQLIAFTKRFKAKTINEFLVRLEGWYDIQIEKLEIQNRKNAIQIATDKYETLKFLAEQHEDLDGLRLTLERLLRPTIGAPVLSTIHKAKGLEWPDVYLLRPDLLPAPWVSEDDQDSLDQERNLHYVAITRASRTFTYLTEEKR